MKLWPRWNSRWRLGWIQHEKPVAPCHNPHSGLLTPDALLPFNGSLATVHLVLHKARELGVQVEPEIEVAILGPVEIRGAAEPFTRGPAVDLVAYLAVHEKGSANEAWATAIWPDRLMAPSTLHSTASAARRALGCSHSGSEHLPRSHGRLRLGPTVTTDWRRLRELASSDDPERWLEGLRLVRGRPFEGLRSTDWAILEGTLADVEEDVVRLAVRRSEHCLRSGNGGAAAQAARRGLLASPFDERLYRLLLRAADAEGNAVGVERVMGELVRLAAGDVPAAKRGAGDRSINLEFVHPDTATLYQSLSRHGTEGLLTPL